MIYRVELTANAERDAENAYDWILHHSPSAAVGWWNGLVDAIESLADSPRRCPLAPENEIFAEEIRQLLYGRRNYRWRIIFTVDATRVLVLHIRRGLRRPVGGP